MPLSMQDVNNILSQRQSDYVFVKDHNSRYLDANERCLSFLGFQDIEHFRGKTDHDLPCASFAPIYIKSDQDAITVGELPVIEPVISGNGIFTLIASTKYAFFDAETQRSGVVGAFKLIDYESIKLPAISLEETKVSHIKVSTPLFNRQVNKYSLAPLTNRELDVLYYTLHGLSQKQVADKLNLSVRTIEDYIDHIKNKLNCGSKSQLFEFAIHYGLMNIVPKHLLDKVL